MTTLPEPSAAEDLRNAEGSLAVAGRNQVQEWEHRKKLSGDIIRTFLYVNIALLLVLFLMYAIDTYLIVEKLAEPTSRMVDQKVLIAIITAITVQFGSIAIGVANWLFPKRPT